MDPSLQAPTRQLFIGAIVTPASQTELTLIDEGLLGVDSDGVICFVEDLNELSNEAQLKQHAVDDGDDDGHVTPRARSLERLAPNTTTTAATPSRSPSPSSSLPAKHRKRILSLLTTHSWPLTSCAITTLPYGSFLCPGFIDTHTHACQVPNIGLGQQYELLDWLTNVTFPREKRFADVEYARKTYESVVQRMIDCGTTTACYYATLHLEATKVLAKVCDERGQRAFVGKCQMDRNSPEDYVEASAAQSVADTKAFIKYCQKLQERGGRGQRGGIQAGGREVRATSISSQSSATTSSSASSSPSERASLASPLTEPETMLDGVDPDEDDEDAILMGESVAKLSKTVDEINSEAAGVPVPAPALAPTATDDTPANASPTSSTTSSISNPPTLDLNAALVQPILTPRFGISCSDSLLTSISAVLSRSPTLRLQTHLSESLGEIAFTRTLFPTAQSYTAAYDHFGLLTPRTVLAHAVHLDEDEMQLVKGRGCGVAHCPNSNLNLRSGATRVGEMLNRGIKVGLGTDVSGGFGLGMLTAVREASLVAKVVQFSKPQAKEVEEAAAKDEEEEDKEVDRDPSSPTFDFTSRPLLPATLLWLATVGGAQVASIEDRAGSLEVGKDFDALVVRLVDERSESVSSSDEYDRGGGQRASATKPYRGNPSCFIEDGEPLADLVEKFLFTADDRNLAQVWVKGRCVGGVDFHRRG